MKLTPDKKNARHAVFGTRPTVSSVSKDYEVIDPDMFVLQTMASLKKLDPATLTPELRRDVEAWTPPLFQCLHCPAHGPLSTCPRIPNEKWMCPRCQKDIQHDPVS